ncbi:MAG: hypothetical protein ACXWW0_00150 [Bacteroidia bacterium]
MATKLKRYPKKPKASASADTLQNWLKRCDEIDRENASRKSEAAKKKTLLTKVRARKPKK